MDSHAFTEPELVSLGDEGVERSSPTEPEPSSPALLEWRVHVLRHGVPEPIGSIRINSTTLPPRRNKAGKIVWKLPDDPNQAPKFGIHEQKRLWELYKEQKKQRRKKSLSANQNPSKGGEAEGADQESVAGSDSALSKNGEGAPVSPSPPRSTGQSSPIVEIAKVAGSPKGSGHHGQTPVSPPPGFGATGRIESLTLEETPSRPTDNPHFFQQQSTPQRNNLSGSHIPPPPGLAAAAPGASPPTPSPALPNGNHASHSPSRAGQADVPRALPIEVPNQQLCNYFTLSTSEELASFPQSVAALVAHAFQRLISVVGVPDGVAEWLSYYAPNARSTLIMGTAQAVANTHDERRRHWQSLSASSGAGGATASEVTVAPGGSGIAGKRWECSGWTAQAVGGEGGATPHDVLVVLAGRTLQQHLLSFNLTLLLHCQRPPQLNGGGHPTPLTFQISNEILSLALLT